MDETFLSNKQKLNKIIRSEVIVNNKDGRTINQIMKITFYSINKETNQDPRLAFTFLLAAQGEYRGYCAAI